MIFHSIKLNNRSFKRCNDRKSSFRYVGSLYEVIIYREVFSSEILDEQWTQYFEYNEIDESINCK